MKMMRHVPALKYSDDEIPIYYGYKWIMTEDSLKVFEMIAILHVQCVIRNFLKKKLIYLSSKSGYIFIATSGERERERVCLWSNCCDTFNSGFYHFLNFLNHLYHGFFNQCFWIVVNFYKICMYQLLFEYNCCMIY